MPLYQLRHHLTCPDGSFDRAAIHDLIVRLRDEPVRVWDTVGGITVAGLYQRSWEDACAEAWRRARAEAAHNARAEDDNRRYAAELATLKAKAERIAATMSLADISYEIARRTFGSFADQAGAKEERVLYEFAFGFALERMATEAA